MFLRQSEQINSIVALKYFIVKQLSVHITLQFTCTGFWIVEQHKSFITITQWSRGKVDTIARYTTKSGAAIHLWNKKRSYFIGYNIVQRSRADKGVVFKTTMIAWFEFNPHTGHVVASLDKTLYDDYISLVALNKQQIQFARIRRKPQKHWIPRKF